MVMTKSSRTDLRRLRKGVSSYKGRTFDQDGLAMDPIDVELLSSAPPLALVPYGTFNEDIPALGSIRQQPLEKKLM